MQKVFASRAGRALHPASWALSAGGTKNPPQEGFSYGGYLEYARTRASG